MKNDTLTTTDICHPENQISVVVRYVSFIGSLPRIEIDMWKRFSEGAPTISIFTNVSIDFARQLAERLHQAIAEAEAE